jgi:hypothetical protein
LEQDANVKEYKEKIDYIYIYLFYMEGGWVVGVEI